MKPNTFRSFTFVLLTSLMVLPVGAVESGEVLLQKLKSSDAAIRRNAAEVLAERGIADLVNDLKKVLPDLLPALKDSDADVRYYVAVALASAGWDDNGAQALSGAVPALIEALKDKDPRVREYSAKAIGLVMPQPPAETAKPLLKLLNDKEKGGEKTVQEAALAALSRIKPVTPEMASAVLKLLKEDKDVKGEAASTLGDFASSDPEVISVLIGALKDTDRFIRQEVVRAFGKIGPPARAALPELKKIADNSKEDQTIRDNAVAALRRIEQGN